MTELITDLEKPLDQSAAIAHALLLAGLGMKSIGIDHGAAIITLAEAMSAELAVAKSDWRRAMRHRKRP